MLRFLYIIIFLLSISSGSEIMKKTELRIREIFEEKVNLEHLIFDLTTESKEIQNTVKQKFFRNELNVWKINLEDNTTNYAILDNVKGKSMPITFLVIFNSNKQVINASIIKYREEPYGGEVKSRNWLKQFIDYSDTSNYKIGSGIDGISGATISVHSISKGIHKLSLIIDEVIETLNEK